MIKPGSVCDEMSLDSEIGVWMQGAAPSALDFILTLIPA
jgi:hypothetical protein